MEYKHEKDDVIEYAAAFLKEGEALPWLYRGGRMTLFEEYFTLSLFGIKKFKISYKEILKVELDRYNFRECIVIHGIGYRMHIFVRKPYREKVLEQLKYRRKAVWKER